MLMMKTVSPGLSLQGNQETTASWRQPIKQKKSLCTYSADMLQNSFPTVMQDLHCQGRGLSRVYSDSETAKDIFP